MNPTAHHDRDGSIALTDLHLMGEVDREARRRERTVNIIGKAVRDVYFMKRFPIWRGRDRKAEEGRTVLRQEWSFGLASHLSEMHPFCERSVFAVAKERGVCYTVIEILYGEVNSRWNRPK